LFVIEGIRQFIQAHDAGFEFDSLIHSPILLQNGIAQRAVRRLVGAQVPRMTVTPAQFRSISTTPHASGIAAIVRQRWMNVDETQPRGIGWLVIESLRATGNFGTILRTAEAVGMNGVILVGSACDPYDPAVVRASMGGIFHLPLVRTQPRELGYWLARGNMQAVALSPQASRLWTDLPPAAEYAIMLGEERSGLSPVLKRLCDVEIRLPMAGRADSLNVAVAAGVMMYELRRRSLAAGL
jgi:TrmH family RNA methyltransferase